ncbi:transforming acidic coiled-coil-containing protein 1-like isoform X2 [Synchiropus splendidus]|uniref:transforming acidic coiled-coil-containing protein 1-like isoform X2 n=1 Tax=Synchiropus splendidus TaxID=270530 RepID=UPI00237D5996|nr:transforming acidic coiled-coil-containing protein 1-like isoform X2 [Synchiropus splendidus]
MSWLSPVSWAKWTWDVVRGGEEEEDEEGHQERRAEEEDEERSQGGSSDSDGHFGTPEAATPIHAPAVVPEELENNNCDADRTDVEQDEQLIVTALTEEPQRLVFHDMGQDEPADPRGDPLELSVQNQGEEQTVNLCEPVDAEPAGEAMTTAPEVADNKVPTAEPPHRTPSSIATEPTSDPAPAPAPESDSIQSDQPPVEPVEELLEEKPVVTSEQNVKGPKTSKPKPPLLDIKSAVDEAAPIEEQEIPLPKATYNFDLDHLDDSFNPFTSGGSKIPNSPPPCNSSSFTRPEPIGGAVTPSEDNQSALSAGSIPEAKPVLLEFGLDEGPASKPPPRKLGGKKTVSKFSVKKQKPKVSDYGGKSGPAVSETPPTVEPERAPESGPEVSTSDGSLPQNLDDVPIPKAGTYNFDPSQWDDPNFNPFGSNSKMSSSPVLPKGSYSFDPDNFDDSMDPFKSSKTLSMSESPAASAPPKAEGKKTVERKPRQIPKKSKERTTKNPCKAEKFDECQPAASDVCSQVEDNVVVQTPEITQQIHHATDEEKLASTGIMAPTADYEEEKEETLKESLKSTGNKQQISKAIPPEKTTAPSEVTCSLKDDTDEISKVSANTETSDTPAASQDIHLSEMDKAAVLTLIREEIITKEIEVNEWKRKYEESRAEVIEMRKIVAEYEKTVAQMIEDEQQQKTVSGSKSVRQLTLERDQAVADLNSVERSFADLFRRYENMKEVLEGFKKNEEVLKKCAQDYLVRIKQEEQRYLTLKAHAEEKLDKANEEIAQVRSKANAEGVALNASLRKEQMKVDSLERAVLQKNQEIEELTKICDELIAKLGTD